MDSNILKEKYGINYLWYFTHINNLESILKEGILSRKICIEKGITFKDISDPDIQKRRKPYQHFVPLFFAPCPPMAYRSTSEYRDEIIVIGITSDIVLSEKFLFSDANISCTDSCISMDTADIKYLDLDLIKCTPTPMSDPTSVLNHMTDIERCKRGAELLVMNRVPPSYIVSISVSARSDKAYNSVDEILKRLDLKIPIQRNLVSDGIKLI